MTETMDSIEAKVKAKKDEIKKLKEEQKKQKEKIKKETKERNIQVKARLIIERDAIEDLLQQIYAWKKLGVKGHQVTSILKTLSESIASYKEKIDDISPEVTEEPETEE